VWIANIAYVWLRKGFPIDSQALFTISGVSLFLLFTPGLLHQFYPKTRTNVLLFGNMSLRVYCLALFTLIGYALGDFASYLGWICALAGFISFGYSASKFLIRIDFQRLFILTVSIFLAAWAVVKVWGIFSLHPLFTEALATLTEKDLPFLHDTLYHVSFSQMIKTYGIPSTGLDGLPYMFYHYGSHWLLGHFSSFVNVDAITMYNVGYPIVFIPLFFYFFTQLALEMQEFFFQRVVANGFFWLIILCFFIPVPTGLYSQGLLGLSLMVNESQTISMIFLFYLLSICLNLRKDSGHNKYIYSLLIPLAVVIIGFLKISTAFVIVPLLIYVYIRYQGYKYRWANLGLILCCMGFVFTYLSTVETVPFLRTKSDEGTFSYFHFYYKTHDFKPVDWFLGFYFWAYLAITLTMIFRNRLRERQRSFRYLGMEAVVITALVGVAPSIFMVFSGGNSMYFSNIQLYVSGLVCLGMFPMINDVLQKIFFRTSRKVFVGSTIIFALVTFLLAWREIRSDLRFMLKKSIQVRLSSVGKDYSHLPNRIKLSGSYIKEAYAIDAASFIELRPTYQYLNSLARLERMSDRLKATTVLFKPCVCTNDIPWNFNCIVKSHLIPAYSGLASIRGIPESCDIGVYGETYYWEQYANPEKMLSAIEVSERAKRDGFLRVLYYNCSDKVFGDQVPACLSASH
jgi:hypothetical protein